MTVQTENLLLIEIYKCNENFIPVGEPTNGDSELDEKSFHMKLRQQAYEHGQYVPEHSTDPDWNDEIILKRDGSDTPK